MGVCALVGAGITYAFAHAWPRAMYSRVLSQAPVGWLSYEPTGTPHVMETIDLGRSFGSNPPDPLKRFWGELSTHHGRISYGYSPDGFPWIPGTGGILLFRVEDHDGARMDFIRANGDFGKVYECADFTLTYADHVPPPSHPAWPQPVRPSGRGPSSPR